MDSIDEVYGASAGSLVGAYAVAQMENVERIGCSIYYDELTKPIGEKFIQKRWFLRSIGLGFLGVFIRPRQAIRDLKNNVFGEPVLDLDWLLDDCLTRLRPLDWERFRKRDQVQPLHVVSSALDSGTPVVLSSKNGDWKDIRSLAQCLRASMLLPGMCGAPQQIETQTDQLVDALLFDSLALRSAIAGGATHIVMLRTRPDGKNLIKTSKVGNAISKRYFGKKLKKDHIVDYCNRNQNRVRYAEDILRLNRATMTPPSTDPIPGEFKPVLTLGDEATGRRPDESQFPQAMAIAMPASHKEVSKTEQSRKAIFGGVRTGFACAVDVLTDGEVTGGNGETPLEATAGGRAAIEVFPDWIIEESEDPVGKEYYERSVRERAASV
jgi:predicted acylesterase/phospholipase RssA